MCLHTLGLITKPKVSSQGICHHEEVARTFLCATCMLNMHYVKMDQTNGTMGLLFVFL